MKNTSDQSGDTVQLYVIRRRSSEKTKLPQTRNFTNSENIEDNLLTQVLNFQQSNLDFA